MSFIIPCQVRLTIKQPTYRRCSLCNPLDITSVFECHYLDISNKQVYVLSAESAYVEKKNNQNVNQWHQRLCHVGYNKLRLIMEEQLMIRLQKLNVMMMRCAPGVSLGRNISNHLIE
ncbi:putative GAG-pre-integrase domain-containing protein [Helianthus annuus]|nr:putative GAG-pre-integrase domain-containing protein [Helianthus annuus]